MNRLARSAAIAAAGAGLCAAAATATAAGVTPPPGTPDLASLTVQPGDLAPGALVTTDAYEKPSSPFTALYVRDFAGARTTPGGPLFALETRLLLAPSVASATSTATAGRLLYSSKTGRRILARELIKAAGKRAHLTRREIRFGHARTVAVGTDGFFTTLSLRVHKATVSEDVLVTTVGPVVESLSLIDTGARPPASIAVALATTVAGRIASALPAGGATGPTGATGTTGATG